MTTTPVTLYRFLPAQVNEQDLCIYCHDPLSTETIVGHSFGESSQLDRRVHAFHLECLRNGVLYQESHAQCPLCLAQIEPRSRLILFCGRLPYQTAREGFHENSFLRVLRVVGLVSCAAHLALAISSSISRQERPSAAVVGLDSFHLILFYYFPEIRAWFLRFNDR